MALEEVFKAGRFTVNILDSTAPPPQHHSTAPPPPPKPLLLAHPTESGDYPVVLLFHGFKIHNSLYTQLLQHIASHGYITVIPQMYNVITFFEADATTEINDAVAISDWLPDGLSYYLPDVIRPDFQKVAISGHSRGGKVAFGLALGRTEKKTKVKLSALVGIDPVDGPFSGLQSKPHILTSKPHSFDLDIPTLVIGSGLGEKWNLPFPPAAPGGVNHRNFFAECSVPSYHFVASDFGHMDFLDDNVLGAVMNIFFKHGEAQEPMRRFCGGVMVAFLNASLRNDSGAFNDLLDKSSHDPVRLEKLKFISKH